MNPIYKPAPPFSLQPWDELGGYDCMTPAFEILDAHNDRVCVIDAKDFGWNATGLGPGITQHREAVRRAMYETALLIVSSVNQQQHP